MPFVLGLDLGANSIGWAVVDTEPTPESPNLFTGVRIFPEGTEKTQSGEQSRNLQRQAARQARRQLERRARRRRKLRHILTDSGILPTDSTAFQRLIELDPYDLRRRALDEALSPDQFGRALLHLNQRRGFKSNLKTDPDKEKDEGKVKVAISELEQRMADAGSRTLGEYLSRCIDGNEAARRLHTSRAMYEAEFDLLWSRQASHHPAVWTDAFRTAVHDAIFHQRPLKVQTHLIGRCPLEPDEPRCPRASWFAQRIRILQDANNLRVLTPGHPERSLGDEERTRLLNALMTSKDIPLEKLRVKILNLRESEGLNFERTEKEKMEGHAIEVGLRRIFKKDFDSRVEILRSVVWESLIADDPEDFRSHARGEWNLSEEQIQALYKIRRPKGYARFSLKAITKLIPHLEAGLSLDKAITAAGYTDPEAETLSWLPPVRPDDFRNPVVTRALSETRKVVNAILREHGRPDQIIIEMARETKGTIESRRKKTLELLDRNSEHQRIADELAELGVPATHEAIEKMKLWEECDGICPYTGKSISRHSLFGDNCQFDVEHILPYPKSLDNSFMNKTLCDRAENLRKHNRTPYEAYNGSAQYDEILSRLSHRKNMPYEKRKRFQMREIPDDFSNRQLTDTSYIARAVVDYLKRLGIPVRTTRGQITAELRRQWGLNSILNGDGSPDAPKMRDDHRHHAVDAVAIALTTPAHIHALSRQFDFNRGERFPSPWKTFTREDFRQAVRDSIQAIHVSHRPQRKIAGQINEATSYGSTDKPGVYVHRVPLTALTAAKALRIVDPEVRARVCDRLRTHGIEPGKGSSPLPAKVFQEPLFMKAADGNCAPVIRSVRILETLNKAVPLIDKSGCIYRYVEPGSNHHVTIFEYTDAKGRLRRCKEIVTRFEAARRLLQGEPVIRRIHTDHPEARFLMSLVINDMALVEKDGMKFLCRVQKITGNDGQESIDIFFRLHTSARIDTKDTEVRLTTLSADKFRVVKVTVDLLGGILPCHD